MALTTHIDMIDTTINSTYEWLEDVRLQSGLHDAHEALQALRGVLHALRDELGIDQNAHFASQLPTLIRGIYFESWNPPNEPVRHVSYNEFLRAVGKHFTGFTQTHDVERVTRGVLTVLERRVSGGLAKLRRTLPPDIRRLWTLEA